MLDALIAIAIILFILSTIVEKITQLIRQYSPFLEHRHWGFIKTFWRNIQYKQTGNTKFDKKVEREINSLSWFIGTVIAILFKVDLFQMFKTTDPRTVLFWKGSDFCAYWKAHSLFEIVIFAASIGLTGFFLSFGSKFFHDLIDTLLQVKNLKRKLVDDETFRGDTVNQVVNFIETPFSEIIQQAIQQNDSLWSTLNLLYPPSYGRVHRKGKLVDCIDLHLKDNNTTNIPSTVNVKLDSGQIVAVGVNSVLDVTTPRVTTRQGDTTANQLTAGFKGTICCKVNKDGKECLLTCSHVFTGGSSKNNFGSITPKPAQIDGKNDGNFIWAICTDEFDLALLEPDKASFNYEIIPETERVVLPSDIGKTAVRVVCREKEIKRGVIVNDKRLTPVGIEYGDGNIHEISNLITISNVTENQDDITYSQVTIPGDSGACVFDDKNRPIGMIVAGNNKFSYAIPIVSLLKKMEASIVKS